MKDKKKAKPKQIAVFFRIDAETAIHLQNLANVDDRSFSSYCAHVLSEHVKKIVH